MELLKQLLGEHAIEVWIAGMFWSLLGIVAVKLYFLNSKVKFNFKFWANDNLIDVVKGMFWAMVILRLGDYILHLAETKLNWTIPETSDFVIYMIVISGSIQYYLHRNRKPISKKIEEEMHVHNENCGH
jgi:hypothetical protein